MKLLAAVLYITMAAQAATLRVQINGRVSEIDVERYVAGVLAGESSVFRSEEALKAMAVAARTYAEHFRARHASEGFDLCDKTHCQRVDLASITSRLTTAAKATAGEVVLYRGQPALTYYHLDCGGRTEDVRAVWPDEAASYLTSHADPYCVRAGGHRWRWSASGAEIANALRQSSLEAPRTLERITLARRTASTRAQVLAMAGGGQNVRISASSLRFAIGRLFGFNRIQSDQYNVGVSGSRFVFDGSGSGHGVGLCQHGADQMGQEGHGYRAILAFYYQGTTVGQTVAALDWRRIAGERVALFTTQPQIDGALLQNAERLLSAVERRVSMKGPQTVELRVYPDVAAFRDATGETGWVAARTSGDRIAMQPASVLRRYGVLDSTLEHEFVHAILENNTRAELPVWFREGLAAFFTKAGSAEGSAMVYDADLRQTADVDRARAAYAAARQRVATLIRDYGETVVLGWIKLGLPREVTNASNKQAPTNKR